MSSVPRHCVHQHINNNWRRDRNSVYVLRSYPQRFLLHVIYISDIYSSNQGSKVNKHKGSYSLSCRIKSLLNACTLSMTLFIPLFHCQAFHWYLLVLISSVGRIQERFSQVLGLTFVYKYSQPKPKIWLKPFAGEHFFS